MTDWMFLMNLFCFCWFLAFLIIFTAGMVSNVVAYNIQIGYARGQVEATKILMNDPPTRALIESQLRFSNLKETESRG